MARNTLKNIHNLIHQAVEVMPAEQAFLADLIAVIERTSETRTPSKSYKPSSLDCLRKMYYQVVGEPPAVGQEDHGLIGMSETGSFRHGIVQQAVMNMQKMGIDCEWISVADYIKKHKPAGTIVVKECGNETKCYNSILNMSFLCDGVIRYKGKYYILEIKTEVSMKWATRKAPDDQHITQATCYSVGLGVDDVMFMYENRDLCSKKSYIVHVTEDMKQERVVGKIAECENYVSKLTPPPKTTVVKHCRYCKYKTACRRDG